MDLLSDVFSNLRLRGEMWFRTEFVGSWGVTLPADRNMIRFHLVVQGQCWVSVDGGNDPLLLQEGDFALIPHGVAQTLSDSPNADAISLEMLLNDGNLGSDGILRYGTGESNQRVRLVCGFCSFDEGLKHPLFFGLSNVIVFRRHATGNSPWLAEAVRVITMEANLGEMGISAIISRLIEVLFIQGIRHQRDTESNAQVSIIERCLLKPPVAGRNVVSNGICWQLGRGAPGRSQHDSISSCCPRPMLGIR